MLRSEFIYEYMKRILFLILLITIGVFIYTMNIPTPWLTDFASAQKESKQSGKPIFLYFSGSDWCTICMKMKKDVLETDIFQSYAKDHLVLMQADFPRMKKNKLDVKTIEQNERLAEKYNPSSSFPHVVLLTSEGKIIKEWKGYSGLKPEAFIEQIKQCKPQL